MVVYSDAASTTHAIEVYAVGLGYVSFDCPYPSNALGCDEEAHINILEFIGSVTGLLCAILHVRNDPTHPLYRSPVHIHTWSDNTTCVSWCERFRSKLPVVRHLLTFVCLLQTRLNVLLTYGYIEGSRNSVADALSRKMRPSPVLLSRDTLRQVSGVLRPLTKWRVHPEFEQLIRSGWTSSGDTLSSRLVTGLTALERIIGRDF